MTNLAPNGSEGEVILKTLPPRINASKQWCFTWNNYIGSNIDDFEETLSKLGKYVIGFERGKKNDTPHIQGYINFYKKSRPMECIKIKEIHWEKCKGSEDENIKYCTKEGNFRTNMKIKKPIKDPMENLVFKEWQKDIELLLLQEPDDRKIYWFWSNAGAVGKSCYTKHLCLKKDALMVTGKGHDIKFIIAKALEERDIEIIIFDIPRVNEGHISYSALEEIKNGNICSGKYEGINVIFNSPHVLCFANFPPEEKLLSQDRWIIRNIDE